MKPQSRDAMKLIRSITNRPAPESFPAIPDPTDYAAEAKRCKCFIPTPEQIREECLKIRAERQDKMREPESVSDEFEDLE